LTQTIFARQHDAAGPIAPEYRSVDEAIKTAELRHGAFRSSPSALLDRYIGLHEDSRPSDGPSHVFALVATACGDDDPRPFSDEQTRGASTDAARSAGNGCDLSFE
jgi:hypothetical protein